MKAKVCLAMILSGMMVLSACGQSPDSSPSSPEQSENEGSSASSTKSEDETEGEAIELSFFHFRTEEEAKVNNETAAFRQSLDKFIADNPNIKLDITDMAHDDYQVKIQAQAAADDMPDIFCMKGSWTENFVEGGLVADLTPYIDALEWKDSYPDGIFKSATYDGKIYGSPQQAVSPSGLVYYNEALWKEIGYETFPETWAEVEEASKKFAEKGITTISLGNKDKWPYESCWISTIGDRFTGSDWLNSIVARDGNAKFTDEDFIKMLDFTAWLGQSGILNQDFNSITNQQSDDLYCQGKAAATIEGYWSTAYIQANASEEILNSTKIAVIPQPEGAEKGEKGTVSGASGWFLAVNDNLEGAARDAAAEFVLSLTGTEFANILASEYGMAAPTVVENVDMSSFHPLVQETYNATNNMPKVDIYDVVLNGSIVDIMNAGLQEILAGTKSPEDLAAELQAEQEALQTE